MNSTTTTGTTTTTASTGQRNAGANIAISGALVGVFAGLIQATVGSRIPTWSGAKASSGALGILTVILSLLAGVAARVLQRTDRRSTSRLIATASIGVVALVCFTTVGRLWYVPGLLLLVGGVLTVDSWRSAGSIVRQQWLRILLGSLGLFELLMAASASPLRFVIGACGGIALVVSSWVVVDRRAVAAALMAIGTIPFAVVAWTAIVPLLLLVVVGGLAIALLRTPTCHAAA